MNREVLIRDYTPADRAACLAVFESNTPDFFLPHEVEEFAAFLDRLPGPYLVAEESGRIVGGGGYRMAPPEAVLTCGMVARDRHRGGIGQRLLTERLARLAADPTIERVRVNTSQHSAGFFERVGFVVTLVEPDGYGPGLHRQRMELALAALRDRPPAVDVVIDYHRPPTTPDPSPSQNGDTLDRAAWVALCNLQRRILPQSAPAVTGYHLVLAYRPAFVVTGDYHDFFPRADGTTAAFIGDGSGHGPAASMLMAIMRTILRTHDLHGEPGRTLAAAGRIFHDLIPSDLFMTGVYALLEPGGRVSWAAAGHHPPLWVTRAGVVVPIDLQAIGDVLGYAAERDYNTIHHELGVGDRLLMFTDGLWDARNQAGEPFSRLRVWQHMQYTMDDPLADAVTGLVGVVTDHLKGAEFEDDFTILGIERVE